MDNTRTSLTAPAHPAWGVFSDFDETWLAHEQNPENRRHLRGLESLAEEIAVRHRVLFAWVSGCTLELILKNCERLEIGMLPHYIAASHGAELVRIDGGRMVPEDAWLSRVDWELFDLKAGHLVDQFNNGSLNLRPQMQRSRGIRSFYLPKSSASGIPVLRKMSTEAGLNLSISPSNAKAGDPADTFDVDFTPLECSKRSVTEYLQGKHGIPDENTIAFGDNVGDIGILEYVRHGYLVANANALAKEQFRYHLPYPYAQGIVNFLQLFFPSDLHPKSGGKS